MEGFSQRLILGENHSNISISVYKRAILTGYLNILLIGICIFYLLFDAVLGVHSALFYYLTLINLAVIAFFLNKTGRYESAKILLLFSTLLTAVWFFITQPVNNGIYLNLFPLTVAAFSLFNYRDIHKAIIYSIISISLFLIVHFFEIPILEPLRAPEAVGTTGFLLHFFVALFATLFIIVFLIRLNHTVTSTLTKKDGNLVKITNQLQVSKQRFEIAISGSDAGIYDWDVKLDVIQCSPKWKNLLGYSVDELEDFSRATFFEFVHPEDVELAKLMLKKHLSDGSRYILEYRLRTKGGHYQWFSDSGQAVWNEMGEPVRMVGSIIKIHERKQAEERILEQNRMLEKTNRELDNFVYSVSHDIRSPLTSILGLVNIAKKTKDSEEIYKCLHMMESRVNRLDEFIEDILDFSRNQRVNKKYREINLNNFIEDIIQNHDFGDEFYNLDVRISIPSDFEVISDPLRLKIIVKNLLSNASKFSNRKNDSQWLRISGLQFDEKFQIIFEDNGQGIRDEYQDRIYDMFYRASEKSTGSGLGLYIVREMIENLNGTINLNSIYGKGSKFIIELPDHNYAHLAIVNSKGIQSL